MWWIAAKALFHVSQIRVKSPLHLGRDLIENVHPGEKAMRFLAASLDAAIPVTRHTCFLKSRLRLKEKLGEKSCGLTCASLVHILQLL